MIRPGGPADLPALGRLHEAFVRELASAGGPPPTTPVGPSWSDWIARRVAAGDVRVCLEAASPVGYVVWELRRRDGRGAGGPPGRRRRRVLVVVELYVAPGERGRRHGSGLLARAVDRARDEGLPEIEVDEALDHEGSRPLFAQHGFHVRGGVLMRPLATS